MSKIMDYLVNGGDDADLAKAEAEHVSGYLGLEIEENEKLRAENERLRSALQGIVDSLASQDEEGLIERAPQMEAARRALAGATEQLSKETT